MSMSPQEILYQDFELEQREMRFLARRLDASVQCCRTIVTQLRDFLLTHDEQITYLDGLGEWEATHERPRGDRDPLSWREDENKS